MPGQYLSFHHFHLSGPRTSRRGRRDGTLWGRVAVPPKVWLLIQPSLRWVPPSQFGSIVNASHLPSLPGACCFISETKSRAEVLAPSPSNFPENMGRGRESALARTRAALSPRQGSPVAAELDLPPTPAPHTSSSTVLHLPAMTTGRCSLDRPFVLDLPNISPHPRVNYNSQGSTRRVAWLVYCAQLLSLVRLSATPWTVASQALLSVELSWQEAWSGLSFPAPGESSQHRDWTCVSCGSCIGRQILYHWATWEAL